MSQSDRGSRLEVLLADASPLCGHAGLPGLAPLVVLVCYRYSLGLWPFSHVLLMLLLCVLGFVSKLLLFLMKNVLCTSLKKLCYLVSPYRKDEPCYLVIFS
jgi:hypothetical protein